MQKMARPMIALLMCAVLASPGCATTGAAGGAQAPRGAAGGDPSVLSDYVQTLPPGSTVRVERRSGRTLRGTLMKATDSRVIVQPRTRIPEPPVDIALTDVFSVTPESPAGHSLARAIAAGAAAGAGAALAVFFIILTYAD
jgi:hypothetical protein